MKGAAQGALPPAGGATAPAVDTPGLATCPPEPAAAAGQQPPLPPPLLPALKPAGRITPGACAAAGRGAAAAAAVAPAAGCAVPAAAAALRQMEGMEPQWGPRAACRTPHRLPMLLQKSAIRLVLPGCLLVWQEAAGHMSSRT
jgi:hypothetical protein